MASAPLWPDCVVQTSVHYRTILVYKLCRLPVRGSSFREIAFGGPRVHGPSTSACGPHGAYQRPVGLPQVR